MIALLAYGSLMHPDELARHFTADRPLVPVRVRGFRRSFSQEPSWRAGHAEERGVLTVHPSEEDWFNAILICGCGADTLELLDRRERGYARQKVPPSSLDAYGSDAVPAMPEINLYSGREEKRNERLLPNRGYLRLCTEAAERWGGEFLNDFLSTTYIGGSTLLDLGFDGSRIGDVEP